MRFASILVAVVGFALQSITQSKAQDDKKDFFDTYIYSGSVQQERFSDTINFQSLNNWVIVDVVIRNELYHFILDSGAPTAVSKDLARKLRLKAINNITIADAAGKAATRPLYRLPDLVIGNTTFQNEGGFSNDFSQMNQLSCFQIDGIIGSNLMRKCNWLIDFPKRHLVVSDMPLSISATAKIPF